MESSSSCVPAGEDACVEKAVADVELDELDEEGLEIFEGEEGVELADDLAEKEGRDDSFWSTEATVPVYSVSVNPQNASLLAAGFEDDTARVYDLTGSDPLHTLMGHTDTVTDTKFSPDGSLLATGSLDGTLKIWSVPDFSLQFTLEGLDSDVQWLAWHPSSKQIAAGSVNPHVWIWNVSDGSCHRVCSGHDSVVLCGTFSPDGELLLTGSGDGTVRVWNRSGGNSLHVFRSPQDDWPPDQEALCLCCRPSVFASPSVIHSQDSMAAVGFSEGTIAVFNYRTKKVARVMIQRKSESATCSIEAVSFCSSQNWLASASMDSTVIVWDLASGHIRHTLSHSDGITCMLWNPAVPILYCASVDCSLTLWDARTGEKKKELEGHENSILCMDVCARGARPFLVTGGDDHKILAFSLAD